jgi:hypothetical protein
MENRLLLGWCCGDGNKCLRCGIFYRLNFFESLILSYSSKHGRSIIALTPSAHLKSANAMGLIRAGALCARQRIIASCAS